LLWGRGIKVSLLVGLLTVSLLFSTTVAGICNMAAKTGFMPNSATGGEITNQNFALETQTEYLQAKFDVAHYDPNGQAGSKGTHLIELVASWKTKPVIGVYIYADKSLAGRDDILKQVASTIVALPVRNETSESSFASWNQLLANVSNGNSALDPQIVNNISNNGVSGIVVNLTSESRQSYLALTQVAFDQDRNIHWSKIKVLDTSSLYNQGILSDVINHEMGHALGLGHSNDQTSIMFSHVVISGNQNTATVVNHIGACERLGLLALSSNSETTEAACSS
jgi:hypothetical protein